MDNDIEAARKFFAETLKDYREGAGRTIIDVAAKIGVGRQYVYLIEKGGANFSIDKYVAALRACGVSFEEFRRVMQSSDIPQEHLELYKMLSEILKSGNKELIAGIRVNLEALSEKAQRLKKKRLEERPPPSKQRHA